jgi:hypothetical protein
LAMSWSIPTANRTVRTSAMAQRSCRTNPLKILSRVPGRLYPCPPGGRGGQGLRLTVSACRGRYFGRRWRKRPGRDAR